MKTAIFTNEEHSYDYELIDRTHYLYYSQDDCWQKDTRGTKILSMLDTGNGLNFRFFNAQKLKGKLDYSQAIQMEILLRIINKEYSYYSAEKVKL